MIRRPTFRVSETLVEQYLKSRALDLPDEAANEAIRFLPNCPLHPEGPGNYSDGN